MRKVGVPRALQAQARFQVPLIFAGLVALAVEGIVMYAPMAWVETRMMRMNGRYSL